MNGGKGVDRASIFTFPKPFWTKISGGDTDAAFRRLALVEGLPILGLSEEVEALAREYHDKLGLPQGARLDVIHLACVIVYDLDYLLNWNCTHLANGVVIQRLQAVNTTLEAGFPSEKTIGCITLDESNSGLRRADDRLFHRRDESRLRGVGHLQDRGLRR